MKFYPAVLLSFAFLGLLSGCAYIEGRKADQQSMAAPATDKSHDKVIETHEPAQPLSNTSPSPASGASRMIAPVTEAVGNL